MRRIDENGAVRSEQPPALERPRLVNGERLRREIAGERRAAVQQERNAVVRAAGCVQDLSRDPDPLEQGAALSEGDDEIALRGDVDVVFTGFSQVFMIGMAAVCTWRTRSGIPSRFSSSASPAWSM